MANSMRGVENTVKQAIRAYCYASHHMVCMTIKDTDELVYVPWDNIETHLQLAA